ncbi:copper transporter [Demequina sediminicola]|uniref:copper transporter n=1 Tax=Demequina sediminicola TaxID=1095026 RepID=UPI0007846FB0|nr:copper transporter [Demequina sediminicola]
MIDFRYHLVSLTAVFLALAVGIVLGSGPMRDALTGSQTEQIDQLNAEVAEAQELVEEERQQAAAGEQYADQTAPRVLAGTLESQSVASIEVAKPDSADAEGVRSRQVQAGASISANVTITEEWTNPDQVAFRSSLASTLTPQVIGASSEMTSTAVLAHALAQALMPGAAPSGEDPADYTAGAQDRADTLWDLLAEAGLVSGTVTDVSTAVTMIAGPVSDESAEHFAVYAEIVGVLGEYATGTVATSGDPSPGDLATSVANSPQASSLVSTVTSGTGYFGQLSTALVLAENIGGNVAQYSAGADASYVPTP